MAELDTSSLLNTLTQGINIKNAKAKGVEFEDEPIIDTMEDTVEYIIPDIEEELPSYEVPVSIAGIKGKKDVTSKQEGINKSEVGVCTESVDSEQTKRITRNGNPFKRGPRKKKVEEKEDMQEVQSEPCFVEPTEPIDNLDLEDKEDEEEDVCFLPEEHIDLDDSEPFGDDSLLVDNDGDSNENPFGFVTLEDDSELEEQFDDTDSFEELSWDNSPIDNDEDEEDFDEYVEENIEPRESEVIEEELDFIGFETTAITETQEKEERHNPVIEEKQEPKLDSPVVTEVTKKLEGVNYTPGMSLVDFLRLNPSVRKEEDVEQFYNKGDIQSLVVKGQVLVKKGKLWI